MAKKDTLYTFDDHRWLLRKNDEKLKLTESFKRNHWKFTISGCTGRGVLSREMSSCTVTDAWAFKISTKTWLVLSCSYKFRKKGICYTKFTSVKNKFRQCKTKYFSQEKQRTGDIRIDVNLLTSRFWDLKLFENNSKGIAKLNAWIGKPAEVGNVFGKDPSFSLMEV